MCFLWILVSFIFLFLENYGVRKLEAVFAVLIATMALSFAWIFGETKPDGKELLLGEVLFLFLVFHYVWYVSFLVNIVLATYIMANNGCSLQVF